MIAPRAAASGVAVLALAFVLAHLPFIPASLEDIDTVNFALGVRDFDVARHRPHPPGYPAYIALGKAAVGAAALVTGHSGDPDADPARSTIEARALSLLSLAGAALAVILLYRLFTCLAPGDADRLGTPWRQFDARALAAAALTVACPLFWYMSVRPMSDVPGFAAALAAQVCLALAWWRQRPAADGDRRLEAAFIGASGRMIVLGSLLAALSIAFRSQNVMLTVPLLMAVLIDRIGRGVAGALVGSSVAFAVGGLLWGVPLLMASGGLNAYLAALGTQAGEDFAGVEMLYLNPTPRVAANALLRTLIFPWDSIALGSIIVGLAIAGAVALAIRDRRALALILVLALPYFGFHLLLQDMDFVRYALPLVPSIAFLAVSGLELVLRRAAVAATGALALWAVAIASTNLVAYASEPSPVARVVEAMRQESAAAGDVVLAMHQTFARPLEAEVVPIATRLAAPPRYEWLELTRYWRENNVRPLWFLADPRRTDLALIDPASRGARREFAWHFQSMSQLGGMRPAAVEWYRMSPPGWFAEEGWALTPEIAGISRVLQRGPHLGPITAWVRRRTGAARMTIGGRHLGAKTDPPVRFTATVDGRPAAEWEARPGFFLNVFDLPPGALSGTGALAKLDIRSTSSSGAPIETAIEQFNLQSAGAMMWGYGEGWNEAEYDPRRGLWRWTSERSAINVIDASTPITLRVLVESPLRNFDAPPTVRITAGGRVLHESHPVADNVIEVTVPLDLLQSAAGVVVIETDRVFVPAERGGPPDYRHLGLRIFGVNVAVPN